MDLRKAIDPALSRLPEINQIYTRKANRKTTTAMDCRFTQLYQGLFADCPGEFEAE
ncbi:hypothetical protein [Sporosarcina sp. E16_8]|uniref:hypothetical protein n=1 Tax=Sporosarcina sp. E16_8 TaxID=2789295 RepID=UPI001A92E6FF|nr:hypothetical protein [Sporosarcina sp. E16_8]MBO0589341.1 hypothetical protein [Sporosarcina sp. E16_8]